MNLHLSLRSIGKYTVSYLLAILAVLVLKPASSSAQPFEPVSNNDLKTGTLSASAPQQSYSLYARQGEILDIRVRRAQGNIVPQFAVLLDGNSVGVWYGYAHGLVGDDMAGGPIQFEQDGDYQIAVWSRSFDQEGIFILSVTQVLLPKQLEIGAAVSGELAPGQQEAFAIQADSRVTSSVQVRISDLPTDLEIMLQNSRTDVLASVKPPLQGGIFNIPRGLEDYVIVIRNGPTGGLVRYEVTSRLLAQEGGAIAYDLGPDGLVLLPNAGDCVVATRSRQTVNVRSGPSTDSQVLSGLAPTEVLVVESRNAENNWYRVRLDEGRTGWVAAWVTRLGGNCENTFAP